MRRPKGGWHYFYSAGVLLYLLTAESFSGCSGGDEERPPPVGPDIHGSWQGSYYRTDRAGRLALTANVQQEGDAVVITTSKPEGTARLLTGTINAAGYLVLTDAADGETWTSYYGPATPNSLTVADFVETPSIEDPEPGLYVLALTR